MEVQNVHASCGVCFKTCGKVQPMITAARFIQQPNRTQYARHSNGT